MALVLRPHSAAHWAAEEVTDTVGTTSGVGVGGDHPSLTATILGQLDEVSARDAFERYGIEEERGGIWMCNPADGDGIEQMDWLIVDDVTWVVLAKKRITHGLLLDHWEILVRRTDG
jgi:hypothetical protein